MNNKLIKLAYRLGYKHATANKKDMNTPAELEYETLKAYRPYGHLLRSSDGSLNVTPELTLGAARQLGLRKSTAKALSSALMQSPDNPVDWYNLATDDHFASDDNVRLYPNINLTKDESDEVTRQYNSGKNKLMVKKIKQAIKNFEKEKPYSSIVATRVNRHGLPLSSFSDEVFEKYKGKLQSDFRS